MYNLAICFTYFIEMLISYSFFSLIGEKKLKVPICFFVGTIRKTKRKNRNLILIFKNKLDKPLSVWYNYR